jgi:hypothetical protein
MMSVKNCPGPSGIYIEVTFLPLGGWNETLYKLGEEYGKPSPGKVVTVTEECQW